ncbi:hypothetical protein ACEWY4_017094 [Coilia grayii]|uniref:THAP-type domain-containing protein n=1 Tax=Coilia grayii TaxID=363190 RepID=A0ABD1JHA9_9TELE
MGGNQCCVINCRAACHDHATEEPDHELSFYSFPSWRRTEGEEISDLTKRRRMAWVAAVGRPDITFAKIPVSMKVCSRHFQSGRPADEMLEDDPDWVPSVHMRPEDDADWLPNVHMKLEDDDWLPNVHIKPEDPEAVGPSPADQEEEDGAEDVSGDDEDEDEERLREPTGDRQSERTSGGECGTCARRRERLNRLLAENAALRYELERCRLGEGFLEASDERVRYYTGLQCFAVLMGLLQHLLPQLQPEGAGPGEDTPPDTPTPLSPFQKLFLTLARLRLDLPAAHLAHLLGVGAGEVGHAFTETLCALHGRLGPLVYWPERAWLAGGVPEPYATALGLGAGQVVALVTCLEVAIERPSSVKGREQTYSYPRRAHTMKYLLALTPQGAVAFVSRAVGGRASDLQHFAAP